MKETVIVPLVLI